MAFFKQVKYAINAWNRSAGSPLSQLEFIREEYDRIAGRYEKHAALESEVGKRLLERVTFGRGDPAVVLDLGCGTGTATAELKKTLRKAKVIGLDVSGGMLAEAGRKTRLTRPVRWVRADINSLPLAQNSVDLVFSNLAMPWLKGFGNLFDEVRRVLKPDGMFLFSTMGPASYSQVYEAMSQTTDDFERPAFPDILEVGDALTAAGFMEPVMDVDFLTLHYPGIAALAEELEATGSSLLFPHWSRLQQQLPQVEEAWSTMEGRGRYPLAYEIIYGAAFGPPEGQPRRTKDGEIATFSVDSLVKSRKLGYD